MPDEPLPPATPPEPPPPAADSTLTPVAPTAAPRAATPPAAEPLAAAPTAAAPTADGPPAGPATAETPRPAAEVIAGAVAQTEAAPTEPLPAEPVPAEAAHVPLVTSNTRLTRNLGRVLFWLVLLQFFSAVLFFGLDTNYPLPTWLPYSFIRAIHFFVGFMLIPLVGFKLATTSWKAAGYYAGRPSYKKEGPPRWYNRLLSPLMGLLFIAVLWSGVAMWGAYEHLFPVPYLYHDYRVVQWHLWSSCALVALALFHIVAHFAESFRSRRRKLVEDAAHPEPHGLQVGRRVAVWGFVGAGVALALSAAQWPWPRLAWLSKYHDGPEPLDYPVVSYFGGGTKVDAQKWRLQIVGAVARPLTLTYEELLKLPTLEVQLPLQCVQGWRIERVWRGVPLKHLYALAGAHPDFQSVYVHSVSGYHFTNHAHQHMQAEALLVTHVNGVPLSDEHGFPARILVPGLPGQNNPKWVDRLEVRLEPAPRYYSPNFYSEWGPTGPLTDPTRAYLKPDSAGYN